MAEYTSNREGFEEAIKLSLNDSPEALQSYADALVLPTFTQESNGESMDYDTWFEWMKKERSRSTEYEASLEDFLRDGDSLAARIKGTVKVDGVKLWFESFHFAKVDRESGKIASLIDRTVAGPA